MHDPFLADIALVKPTSRSRIKICCIQNADEAALAIRYGASALGLVSSMPSGPGVIPEERIAEIARTIPPGVTSVLLTSHVDADSIIEQQRRTGVNALQLCDRLDEGAHQELRRKLPGISIIQVVHVTGPESIDEALSLQNDVDAFLLDSGRTDLAVKVLGGTGKVHDWGISRELCSRVARPVFLAGGLTPENVGEAVRVVAPYGIDVCTGVRSDGRLDEAKLRRFVAHAV